MKTTVLWQKLLDGRENEEGLLYGILHEMVVHGQFDNFPPEAAEILLGLLDETHEPQVSLLTCVLLGHVCNQTSVARNHLAQRGALSSLAGVLNRCFLSLTYMTVSAEQAKLHELLVKFVLSMLQYFSFGASVCISKILQRDTLNVLLSAVECSTCGLYVCGNAETKVQLEQLVAGRTMVGYRMWTPSIAANDVYNCLLGCDAADILGADLLPCDTFVVDLYDTNGDDDIHIIEELMLSCKTSSVWESVSEDVSRLSVDDGEWVDVYVARVLDGAHFVAVFGAENVEQFQELCKNMEAAVVNHSTCLTHLPSFGEIVLVSHPELGSFRAFVVSAESSENIVIFAPDCGYAEQVPLSYLRTYENSSVTLPSQCLVHVCKLMGQYPVHLVTVRVCLLCVY